MREILFRGQTTVTKRWIYGFYGENLGTGQSYIREKDDSCYVLVIPETIGQYTGLTDKNDTKVFEGDIIRAFMDFGPAGLFERIALVGWHDKYGYQWNYFDTDTIEVIGNIHDNPELLKGGVQE